MALKMAPLLHLGWRPKEERLVLLLLELAAAQLMHVRRGRGQPLQQPGLLQEEPLLLPMLAQEEVPLPLDAQALILMPLHPGERHNAMSDAGAPLLWEREKLLRAQRQPPGRKRGQR